MTTRRTLARLWRRLKRPSLPRLAVASLVLHAVAITLAAWLVGPWGPPPPPPEPLVVELPPAEPGHPLVRPETPSPPAASAPPARAARPARPAPTPPPPSVTPPAPTPAPPPTVARVPEPPTEPTPPVTPEPAPVPAPAPPEVARAAPEPAPPAPPAAAPSPSAPSESPFAGQRFSLLRPQLDVPAFPRPLPGGGGTAREGEGAGESGREREGGPAIPLNQPPDTDHADYFLKVKKAIEEHWSYPTQAARNGQSGQLVLEFVIHKDGHVLVELVRSSGIDILDRYAVNAVKLSAPFPPVPDRIGDVLRISASFTYILDHGFRVFGLK